MFESILADAALGAEQAAWSTPMRGVKVCTFDGVFSAVHRPPLLPKHYETLFCQGGTLYIHTDSGRSCQVQKGDLLLVSDTSRLQMVSCSTKGVQGTVVAVHAAEAGESLLQVCASLGQLELDVKQVGRLLCASEGCACIHGGIWCEALFHTLAELPAEEREGYCVLKAVELLYLLCKGSLDLSQTWREPCGGPGQLELARQVNDYIQAHLTESLTIDRLAKQFHCSPTVLKASFRQSYGAPIHRWISASRLRRGAELLDTTSFSILQIASEVGYNSTSQFSAMFKRRYQLSPAQYRRRGEKTETGDFSV